VSVVFLAAAFTALRIISLAPSLTEDLYAVGAGPQIVAVDSYSNRPAAARRLPRVGSMGNANGEAILALRPDLVVGIDFQARLLSDISRAGVRVEVVPLDDLAQDLAAIDRLGILSGHAAAARALHARIAGDLATVARRAARRPVRSAFVAIGTAPIYTAGPGSYIDDVLRLANLRNIVAKSATPWPLYSEESLVVAQPDVVVVPGPARPLTGMPWDRLGAVRAGHVVTIPEDDLLRPGPHVAEVLRTLVSRVNAWR
jgi:ABC-type Fe3+-hydroxamate transport system substrate-binding protein